MYKLTAPKDVDKKNYLEALAAVLVAQNGGNVQRDASDNVYYDNAACDGEHGAELYRDMIHKALVR